MSVDPKEVVKVLRDVGVVIYRSSGENIDTSALADRIEAEGIAPPDGTELVADIEGVGCCTVVIRNGRVHIAAVTVRDIINMGAGKIAPPDINAPGNPKWMSEVCLSAATSMEANGLFRTEQLRKVSTWIAGLENKQ